MQKDESFLPFYEPTEGIVVMWRGKEVDQEKKDKGRGGKGLGRGVLRNFEMGSEGVHAEGF
eukprot:1435209-Amphidinium_carterae.1